MTYHNAMLKKMLQQLKDIGFIEYSVEKENGDYILYIAEAKPKTSNHPL
ncbi:MAG: hypothetical protein RR962_03190 [Hafnia sp.]